MKIGKTTSSTEAREASRTCAGAMQVTARGLNMLVCAAAIAFVTCMALASASPRASYAADGGNRSVVATVSEIVKLKYAEAVEEAAEDAAEAARAVENGDPEAAEELAEARESAKEAEEARLLVEKYGDVTTSVVLGSEDLDDVEGDFDENDDDEMDDLDEDGDDDSDDLDDLDDDDDDDGDDDDDDDDDDDGDDDDDDDDDD